MPDSLGEKLQSSLGSAYTITRELGGGGMSRVFVAEEEALGRKVVVKIVAPELAEGMSAERFARCRHRRIAVRVTRRLTALPPTLFPTAPDTTG